MFIVVFCIVEPLSAIKQRLPTTKTTTANCLLLQGTTRAYHVLFDEIGFSPDSLQVLEHALSYM